MGLQGGIWKEAEISAPLLASTSRHRNGISGGRLCYFRISAKRGRDWSICLSIVEGAKIVRVEVLGGSLGEEAERKSVSKSYSNSISAAATCGRFSLCLDRKSTRLNSSHRTISYAVFC